MEIAKKMTKLGQIGDAMILGDDEGNVYCIQLIEPEPVHEQAKKIMVIVEHEQELVTNAQPSEWGQPSETEIVEMFRYGVKVAEWMQSILIGFSKKNRKWHKFIPRSQYR